MSGSGYPEALIESFWARVQKGDGCWEWQAGKSGAGYGQLSVDGEKVYAHRFSYEVSVGLIPAGLSIDHLCENKPCVNPAHLEPVTHAENLARYRERRTHCKWGHELTPENTYEYVDSKGYKKKRCRECLREKQRRLNARRREENPPEAKAPATHCKYDHEYTEANTSYTPEGWRRCRECDRIKAHRQKAKKREGAMTA